MENIGTHNLKCISVKYSDVYEITSFLHIDGINTNQENGKKFGINVEKSPHNTIIVNSSSLEGKQVSMKISINIGR